MKSAGVSVKGWIRASFLSLQAKIKPEHITRKIIREQIEPKLSELIDKINLIIADIKGKEKKNVLVIIDDLDKPGLEQAKEIFYDNFMAIAQPACYIVCLYSADFYILRPGDERIKVFPAQY